MVAPAKPARRVLDYDGWTLHEYDVADSTNLVAANLPAWSAVRADIQTAGRGRFQRSWISDAGGLWLSAVVPRPSVAMGVDALPLAVGLAVCEGLRGLAVPDLRLRWPNDVLVAERKLAGLLLDQFQPGLVVAGIGVNVRNHPAAVDARLQKTALRLVDVLPSAPEPAALALILLREIRRVVAELADHGFQALLQRVNSLWGPARPVELDLDGVARRGVFSGVDEASRLILTDPSGRQVTCAAHEVRHLQEVG